MPDETYTTRPGQPHEDAIRFLRQVLLARAEGRTKDAEALLDFIDSEFPELGDVAFVEYGDVDDADRARWDSPSWITDGDEVAILRRHANEAIFRNPRAVDGPGAFAPGVFETPLHLLVPYFVKPWDDEDPWENSYEHMRPRSKTDSGKQVRKLPDAVEEALRPWTPEVPA